MRNTSFGLVPMRFEDSATLHKDKALDNLRLLLLLFPIVVCQLASFYGHTNTFHFLAYENGGADSAK